MTVEEYQDQIRARWMKDIPAELRRKDGGPNMGFKPLDSMLRSGNHRAQLAPDVMRLRAQGLGMCKIAAQLGIGKGTVRRIIREAEA